MLRFLESMQFVLFVFFTAAYAYQIVYLFVGLIGLLVIDGLLVGLVSGLVVGDGFSRLLVSALLDGLIGGLLVGGLLVLVNGLLAVVITNYLLLSQPPPAEIPLAAYAVCSGVKYIWATRNALISTESAFLPMSSDRLI